MSVWAAVVSGLAFGCLLAGCDTAQSRTGANNAGPVTRGPMKEAAQMGMDSHKQARAVYPHAAVAADHGLASEAGAEILRKGGNAVDAAVATSFALSVVRPYSCGVGGGGFLVINLRTHPKLDTSKGPVRTAINYRETAPSGITPKVFETIADADAPTHGGRSVCVPGHVAGMLLALEKYGTMDRATVLAPAIRLAREGFVVDAHYAEQCYDDEMVVPWIKADQATRSARFAFTWDRFLKRGAVKIGDRITLPEQAKLFEKIVAEGRDGFYAGDVARKIVDAVQKDGGWVTMADMAAYRPEEHAPLTTEFEGRTILSMPPPSSGGIVMAQVLGMLESGGGRLRSQLIAAGHNSAAYVHLVTEASKHSFADRARWLGDANFVDIPLDELLSDDAIAARAREVVPGRVLPHAEYGTSLAGQLPEDHGTSHLCVVDAWGNSVGCTETVNLIFGSLLAVPEYGFVLNNTMDDFLTRAGHANAFGLSHADRNRPEPGKRPLSSMTPTIVLDSDGAPYLIAGGSGGPRIISGTLQASLNVLLFDMHADDAVAMPRFHHQWEPDVLQLEAALTKTGIGDPLRAIGHNVGERKVVGNVQIIRRAAGKMGWEPASDPRKGGVAAGY